MPVEREEDTPARPMRPGPDAPCTLVLASKSPRRRELVRALDVQVSFADPQVDEGPPHPGEPPGQYVSRLSLEKARACAETRGPAIVIAADTAVVVGSEILGKPSDEEEASGMLRMLRGRVHTVVTGVTLLHHPSGRRLQATRSTGVRIRSYSDAEAADYLSTGSYRDKAGGYAVQDTRLRPADEVLGCYLNAMGFPLCEVAAMLVEMGVRARLTPGWRLPGQCVDCSLREPRGDDPQ